ncbi:MAG: hypothetical protein BWY69_00961 [Planctomycetes bacterium ADurb.Bin401]|nr:MAG: hypothetical protein BWY69_00961 [Planctomycetes bacterium ADurb.Bin401]
MLRKLLLVAALAMMLFSFGCRTEPEPGTPPETPPAPNMPE